MTGGALGDTFVSRGSRGAWQTPTVVLHGRRGTYGTWLGLVTRLGAVGRL